MQLEELFSKLSGELCIILKNQRCNCAIFLLVEWVNIFSIYNVLLYCLYSSL